MDEPLSLWNGALSIIHPSEIICKIVYDKFFLHYEASVILGAWRTVIQSQRREYEATAANEDVTRQNNNSFMVYNPTTLRPVTSLPSIFNNLRASASKDSPHKQAYSQDSIMISPKGASSIAPLNLDSCSSSGSNSNSTNSSNSSGSSNVVHSPKSQMAPLASSSSSPAYAGVKVGSPSAHGDFVVSKPIPQYQCFIFPYMSSFGVPKNDAKELKRVFGKEVLAAIKQYILSEFQGDQIPGSSFLIKTKSKPCKYIVCVCMGRDNSLFPVDYAYTSLRAAFVAVQTFNKAHPEKAINSILCPVFEAPHVSPFNTIQQMETCFEYWDWKIYPPGDTIPPITKDAKVTIMRAIKGELSHAPEAYLANIITAGYLESRGIVYDYELAIIMSWIVGTLAPPPLPSIELAKILLNILKQPETASFTLSHAHIYSSLTPRMVNYILTFARSGVLHIHDDIPPENVQWGNVIGQGTSGKVYDGVWNKIKVAVKKFFVADPPTFRHELTLISLIRHPHLVTCYGGYANDKMAMLVLEFMDCTLYDFIHSKRPVDFSYKIRLAQDVAEGMEFLHARGLIHRDLKSVNVLLHVNDFEICAKVCDFGLARVLDPVGKMTGNVGTVAWIAPEVFQNKKYSEKCDVYSFGVILYELLTSTIPFRDTPAFRVPALVIKGQRPFIPPEVQKLAPKEYIALIHQCWHHNPAKRPTFSEILNQLAILRPVGPRNSRVMAIPEFDVASNSQDSSDELTSLPNSTRTVDTAVAELSAKWASKKRTHGKSPLITDALKTKCLQARQLHVGNALILLKNYLTWYQYLTKGKPITIDLVRKSSEAKLLYDPQALDIDGNPYIIYHANDYYAEKLPPGELIKLTMYNLERIRERGHITVTVILMVANFSMANFSYRALTAFVDTFAKYFPITIHNMLLYDPPAWMHKVVSLAGPALGALRPKVKFVKKGEMSTYINPQDAVGEIGGTLQFDIGVWIRRRCEIERVEYYES